MKGITFYLAGDTAALRSVGKYLSGLGQSIAEHPTKDVTHLLLPVPSFDADGSIKGGDSLEKVLAALPEQVTVIGGNLDSKTLQGRNTIDLLQDARYLAENAAITADCAIRIAGSNLPVVFRGCPVLIIGWGRIGKCLALDLKAAGAEVTVAARKESDRATAQSLGLGARDTAKLDFGLSHYRVIFNTVPSPVLTAERTVHCRDDCIKIDLASKQGIFGNDVIWARGLPNRDTPESSGILIAKTVLRLLSEKEAQL